MDFSTEDKREQPRTPQHSIISFSAANSSHYQTNADPITAEVIDISATGMGIETDVMLGKKQIINFNRNQLDWELPDNGVVVWSCKNDNGYRAGIEFITPGEKL